MKVAEGRKTERKRVSTSQLMNEQKNIHISYNVLHSESFDDV